MAERNNADALNEFYNGVGGVDGIKQEIDKKLDATASAESAKKLVGTPTAPTPTEGDNSERVATTEFVVNLTNKLLSFADEDLDTFVEVIDAIKALKNTKASTADFGAVKVGSNISVANGVISLTKNNVSNALGFVPLDMTLYSGTGQNVNGAMTQKATTDALNTKLGATATAASATQLATARSVQTNLGSNSAASFNGTANITPGVSGILPTWNGGTGTSSGLALVLTGDVSASGTFSTAGGLSMACTVSQENVFEARNLTPSTSPYNGDMNNITTGGFYRIQNVESWANKPGSAAQTWYMLVWTKKGSGVVIQQMMDHDAVKLCQRVGYKLTTASPTWTEWKKVVWEAVS